MDYWRTHGQFGPFREMLDASLRHRLREPAPLRVRSDDLDTDRALKALERVGAALILQKQEYILLPDTALALSETRSGLDLRTLLEDWSASDQHRLLNRPVFDPVVAGLISLHNDNEGVVRSYLAARWLKRVRDQHCPLGTIMDLLFATTYDVEVVIPSMRQTAAWLSSWDADIADRVMTVDPLLLMAHGDPASLPLTVRERVLRTVVQRLREPEDLNNLDRDNLQRFARADLARAIRALWRAHSTSPLVRRLLLTMIWLGAIRDPDCVELARHASFGRFEDRSTQIHAGRALMAVGSIADNRRYLDYLLKNARDVHAVLISDAVDELFGASMSVDELLQLLESVDLHHGTHRIDFLLPKLPERLSDIHALQRFAAGLFAKMDRSEDADRELDDTIVSALAAASQRELELSAPERISDIAIDGALHAFARRRRREPNPDLIALLLASAERRRALLYRAASWFATEPGLGQPIDALWQFAVVGLPLQLQRTDIGWLLSDAEQRTAPAERQLATDAWMSLVYHEGITDIELAPIRAIGLRHPEVASVVERWTRAPSTPQRPSTRALRRLERRNAIEQAEQDASWRDFAEQIRRDPAQLRAISPLTDCKMDRRLYRLWVLLSTAADNRSRLSIVNLDALAPIFDDSVRVAIRDALIGFWRQWTPRLRSERPASERQAISNFDQVGMTGIALEARAAPDWAARLSQEEALIAMRYATLEINGFPFWIDALARSHPEAARRVLTDELAFELSAANTSGRTDTLEQIARANCEIGALVVAPVHEYLRTHTSVPFAVLQPALRALSNSMSDQQAFEHLLAASIERETEPGLLATYFEYLFRQSPAVANASLEVNLAGLDEAGQTRLVQAVLPRLVGDEVRDQVDAIKDMPLATLERLVRIAYRTIRVEDDNDHSDGRGYTPDDRDDAESARSALFGRLVSTPGRATFRALAQLSRVPHFPIPKKRLEALRAERAAADSEHAPWSSEEVRRFEVDHLVVPHTPADLHRLIQGRIRDLQRQLLHAEFSQGETLASLTGERAVQRWLADRFEQTQGRSCSVERESVLAEEKAPDVRFRAKASTASLPLEIKVAESWAFKELQDALDTQLVKQYLRDPINRFGILLLVHQKPECPSKFSAGPRKSAIDNERKISRKQELRLDCRLRSIDGEGYFFIPTRSSRAACSKCRR